MITVTVVTPNFAFEGPVPFGTTVESMRGRQFPSDLYVARVGGDAVSDEFVLSRDDCLVLQEAR